MKYRIIKKIILVVVVTIILISIVLGAFSRNPKIFAECCAFYVERTY